MTEERKMGASSILTQKLYCTHTPRDEYQKRRVAQTLEDQVEHFEFLRTVDDEPFTTPWLLRVKDRIRQASIVICLISETTFMDNAVLWQLTVAFAMKKRVLGITLDPEGMCIIPEILESQRVRIISLQEALTRYESSNQNRAA